MKKYKSSILLSAVLSALLVGCGGGGDPVAPTGGSSEPTGTSVTDTTGTTPTGTTPTGTTPTGTTPGGEPGPIPPIPPTLETVNLAVQFLAAYDAQRATAIPTSAASLYAATDSCSLSGGNTKALLTAAFNADAALVIGSRQFDIGSVRKNIEVLAERNSTNADGSTRREIDIKYDVLYTDGSADTAATTTLITGSSYGSCDAPQTGADVRFFGNRRVVDVYMQGRNLSTINLYRQNTSVPVASAPAGLPYPTATSTISGVPTTVYLVPAGSPSVNAPVTYRRDVLFGINDPSGKATYLVVTGPGPATSVAGVTKTFSVKMISPRLLRDDALLAGKRGNYTNWKDDDSFRFCSSVASGILNAELSDCVTNGGAGNNFGWNRASTSPNTVASSDAGFDAYGFQVGNYTFNIYNDDGWKTVNGQAGKTPIATYTARLEKLPYSFADMGVTLNTAFAIPTSKFPQFSNASLSTADIAARLQLSTATTFTSTWTAPVVPDADVWRLSSGGEYFDGAKSTNTLGAFWPALRFFTPAYPSSTALTGTTTISAKPAEISVKNYSEFSLTYTNRNGGRIQSAVAFN